MARRIPIYARAGDDGKEVRLGALIVPEGAEQNEIDLRLAGFYRGVAKELELRAGQSG